MFPDNENIYFYRSVSSFGGTGYVDRVMKVFQSEYLFWNFWLKASVTSTQISAVALEQENKELIQKLARTQEERAILEEKVRHLESSSSSMANDLIQQYSNNDKRGSVSGRFLFLWKSDVLSRDV